MDNQNNYIQILIESLDKKIQVLNQVIELNQKQFESVQGQSMDDETFNETIEEKEKCIQIIHELDEGFDKVYDRVREEINHHKDRYADEIELLKQRISEVTEKSMEVQIGEKRNESAVLKALSEERKNIRQSKVSTKAATDYYKNMNSLNYVDPQFLDRKN